MLVLWAWPFGAVWAYALMGSGPTAYALDLGVSAFGFGLLGAAPFIGAAIQLPVSLFVERYGHRKMLFMTTGPLARSMWLGLAAIPWVGLPERVWPWALVGGTLVAMLFVQMGVPAWLSWAAELIPRRLRGRYMAQRMRLGQLVGAAVALAMGLLLDWAGDHTDELMLRRTVSAIYVAAGLLGMVDYAMHIPVHVPEPPRRRTLPWTQLLIEPLADRDFRWYLGFNAMLTMSIGYVGQFVNLYLLEEVCVDLKDKHIVINVMTVVIPLLIMVLVLRPWGRLMDRVGRRPVMVLSMIVVSMGAVAWIFVRPENWYIGYAIAFVATAAWPALELGNLNILLALSESRGGTRSGTAYVAVNSLVIALAGALSGVVGGALAEAIGNDWRWQIPLIDWPVTYHGVLFLVSGAGRLGALFCLIQIHEPGSARTRDTARYLAANIYSNLQQAIFLPARLIDLADWFRRRASGDSDRPEPKS